MKQRHLKLSTLWTDLNHKQVQDMYNIPVDIMKFSILHTAPYLAKIINLSFTTGFVPNMLKIAKQNYCYL